MEKYKITLIAIFDDEDIKYLKMDPEAYCEKVIEEILEDCNDLHFDEVKRV